jgi:hypothetical protein
LWVYTYVELTHGGKCLAMERRLTRQVFANVDVESRVIDKDVAFRTSDITLATEALTA